MRLTLRDVAEVTGGRLAGDPAMVIPSVSISSVSVDSRSLSPGALFVALVAERDGHDFVVPAFRAGAAVALVTRAVTVPDGGEPAQVVVEDTGEALCALGRHAGDRLAGTGVPVVGITGSTGKTSTKDLTVAALSSRLAVAASPASWNNEIGVPLTLLSAGEDTRAVVAEMGSRGAGHIARLCALARPRIGIITNIGIAHTEFFGSRAEVAAAKGELLENLPAGGHALLCADDDMTPRLAQRSPAPVLTVGFDPTADVRVGGVTLDAELRPSFRLETPWGSVAAGPLPVRGAHQAMNAGFAVAAAGLLGISPDDAAGGLVAAVPSAWRMDLRRTPAGLIVLNDAYNANPASMAAALAALAQLTGGRRFAVLGHMAELGACSDEEHHRIGRLAGAAGLDALVVVGAAAAALAAGAREEGVETTVVADAPGALAVLAPRLRSGDSVLVKGSRVVGLETVAAALAEHVPAGTPAGGAGR